MQPNKPNPELKKAKQAIYAKLKQEGLSHKASIAVMANISVATDGTFNPKHQDKMGVASGLFHWQGDLKTSYWEFCKYYHLLNCEVTQISFMMGVVRGPEEGMGIGKDTAAKIK